MAEADEANPPLDVIATDLALAVSQLRRRLRAATGADGINLSEMEVLTRLDKNGWMSTAELARAASMTGQSMGMHIMSLERRGLLKRRPHATDGRQIQFALTELGHAERAKRSTAKREWLAAAIGRLSPTEIDALIAGITLLGRLGQN